MRPITLRLSTRRALQLVVSPLIIWSELRRAPLWRTVAEPLVAAVAGGCIAVVLGAPLLILALPPIGLGLGFANLRLRYPDQVRYSQLPSAQLEPPVHAK